MDSNKELGVDFLFLSAHCVSTPFAMISSQCYLLKCFCQTHSSREAMNALLNDEKKRRAEEDSINWQ